MDGLRTGLLVGLVLVVLGMGCGVSAENESPSAPLDYSQSKLAEVTYYVNRNLELEGYGHLTPTEFRDACNNFEDADWEITLVTIPGVWDEPNFSPDWEFASDVVSAVNHYPPLDTRRIFAHHQVWQHATGTLVPLYDRERMTLTEAQVTSASAKLAEFDRFLLATEGYSGFNPADPKQSVLHWALTEIIVAPREIAAYCQHWLGPEFETAFPTFVAPPTPTPRPALNETTRFRKLSQNLNKI